MTCLLHLFCNITTTKKSESSSRTFRFPEGKNYLPNYYYFTITFTETAFWLFCKLMM